MRYLRKLAEVRNLTKYEMKMPEINIKKSSKEKLEERNFNGNLSEWVRTGEADVWKHGDCVAKITIKRKSKNCEGAKTMARVRKKWRIFQRTKNKYRRPPA